MSCKSCSSFNSSYTTANLSSASNLNDAITKINAYTDKKLITIIFL